MDVITTHVNADFDSLGAMIGARKLYPEAVLAFSGSQEKSLRQFLVESTLYAVDVRKAKTVDLDRVRRLILVDVAQPDRIGRFGVLVGRPGVEVHVYDHHPPGPGDAGAQLGRVERVGAATTILAEILREKRIPVEPDEATLMVLGIYEDTGCLTFASTTPRDLEAAAWLLGQGADLTAIPSVLTPELTVEQVSLLDDLLRSRIQHSVHGVPVTVAEASAEHYVGDLAALAHRIRDMENIDALVLLVRLDDRVQLVGRSRVPQVDVSKLARAFGGGGHPHAASATIRDLTLVQARERLLAALPSAVRRPTTARDIWSTPVKSVPSGTPLPEVAALLDRYHVNAMPVVRDGALLGIVTRLTVGRALQHGLADAAVDDYMLTEFATVAPDAPLERLREIVIRGNQRFLPVLEEGRLLGAVTRTDLLRALDALDQGEPLEVPREPQERHAGKLLEERLEGAVLRRLRELGEAAEALGMRAYLVGGLVRDLLLRRDNQDVDVVVEGDGIALAEAAAARWGGRVRSHRAFGTATMVCPDGFRLDLATARTEFYPKPAALPDVEWSSLKLDLYRRDFTVNTLALRLSPGRFGEVIDFFGSLRDLKEGTIRVLHSLSFVEDPTRVLRALRFQLRFGFRLGRQTERLLHSAVRAGFVGQARGRRLFTELALLLGEANPREAIEALDEHGLLPALHPGLRLDAKARGLLGRVGEAVTWFRLLYLDTPLQSWLVYLLALLDGLGDAGVEEFLREFGVGAREAAAVRSGRQLSRRALLELRTALSAGDPPNSAVYGILHGCPPEPLVLLMARTEDERKRRLVSRYCTQLAGTRTLLRGKDLQGLGVPPGPAYRELLGGLLRARLDGEVSTREDEAAWVRGRLRGRQGAAERGAPEGRPGPG